MANEEKRYRVLKVKKKRYQERISKNSDMMITGSITGGSSFVLALISGYSFITGCTNYGDLIQILSSGVVCVGLGLPSLIQIYKIARNTMENEYLKRQLKEIQFELNQLREYNLEDNKGMGR